LYSLADLALGLWKDGPILIHCAAGLNRSGLIMGLMLVRSGQMTAQEAIDAMRQKRSQAVLFNTTFRNWLLTQNR
jgi:protein-tyrosine phosphatase